MSNAYRESKSKPGGSLTSPPRRPSAAAPGKGTLIDQLNVQMRGNQTASLAVPLSSAPAADARAHELSASSHLPEFDGAAPVIQARSSTRSEATSTVQQAAAHGTSGSGGPLPHVDQIQKSFGPAHDLSNVRAHTDAAAADGSAAMGAEAFATGNHIAFCRYAESSHRSP
jgi:hypothetical protein